MMNRIQAKSMNKHRPEALRPGDMWRGYDKNLWVLISSKRFNDPIFPKLSMWELSWFGKRDSHNLEIIVNSWTSDSRFLLVSKVGERDE